jgi:hypothetical protein
MKIVRAGSALAALSDVALASGRGASAIVNLVFLGLLSLAGCVVAREPAETVLQYADIDARLSQAAAPRAAASPFHDWVEDGIEAQKIIDAWRTEAVTIPWTRLQLGRHIKHKMSPTRGARGLALMHVAMHDAYVLALAHGLDSKFAVSQSAADVLSYLYASEEDAFERVLLSIVTRSTGTQPADYSEAVRRALSLGKLVAAAVVDRAEHDGAQRGWNGSRLEWYGDGRYYGPGTWEPTPPYYYYPPNEPFAPGWKTWVMERGDQFRPTPPAYGSPRFIRDLKEVVEVVEHITPEQLAIAKYWVAGNGSVTPPGQWNQIAIEEVNKAKLSESETVRLFATMNIAMADAFIAVWDAKYHYWTIRPITAAKRLLGKNLKPPILTPPFPSYVSGHSGFSGAAARVLGAYIPAEAKRYDAMAEEAAVSRLYGGIHYRHDNDDGLVMGRRIADLVIAHMKNLR